MWTLIRHPILALRAYQQREMYLIKCREIGITPMGGAMFALEMFADDPDPYAAAWAWLAAAVLDA